jgi:hypothetical protein
MASFSELQFGPHPDVDGGIIAKKEFENGYGVIVERYYITDDRGAILQYTLGSESGLYQIGFTKNGEAFFEDPLPDNIIGAASEEVVTEIMTMVETLKTPIIITDDDENDNENDDEGDIIDYRHDDSFIRGNSIGPIEL